MLHNYFKIQKGEIQVEVLEVEHNKIFVQFLSIKYAISNFGYPGKQKFSIFKMLI